MKILMVIGQFHPVIGGAEQQCRKLAKALMDRGHTVSVVTTRVRGCPRRAIVDGIPIERVWYPVGFLAPLFMCVRIFFRARRADVIHVHQALWPLVSAVVVGVLQNKPVICKIGNSGELFDLRVLRRRHVCGRLAVWFVKRHVTRFVWISRAVLVDVEQERIAGGALTFIPNGVELPTLQRKHGDLTSKTRFIFTGTLTRKKNLCALLDAVACLTDAYRERMHLLLLGDGEERARLMKQIVALHLEQVVAIAGPVDDVSSALLESDVFVLPSATEGLSNSALEAMAHGLPVILSDRGGNPDLVPHGKTEGTLIVGHTGILIDHERTQSLCDALVYLMDRLDIREQMGDHATRLIREAYAMDRVADQYERLYRALV